MMAKLRREVFIIYLPSESSLIKGQFPYSKARPKNLPIRQKHEHKKPNFLSSPCNIKLQKKKKNRKKNK